MSRHGMPRRTARCAVYTGKPGWVQEAFFRHVRGSGAGWCDPTWPRLPCDLWSCLSPKALNHSGSAEEFMSISAEREILDGNAGRGAVEWSIRATIPVTPDLSTGPTPRSRQQSLPGQRGGRYAGEIAFSKGNQCRRATLAPAPSPSGGLPAAARSQPWRCFPARPSPAAILPCRVPDVPFRDRGSGV